MKKLFLLALIGLILTNCNNRNNNDILTFATSADYPPFEYISNGKLIGFEIELGEMIAQELGKKVKFQDMNFSSVLAAVQNSITDAAISTITITENRQKHFDFSDSYYIENIAIVFHTDNTATNVLDLSKKKIACQLGSIVQIWLEQNVKNAEIITTDSNPQAIESLKSGYVDYVLIDAIQGDHFSKNNPELSYKVIAKSENGYAIAFKKGSPLKEQVNKALLSLTTKGLIQKLQNKYLLNP